MGKDEQMKTTTADLKEMANNVYSCRGDVRRACRLLMRKTIEGMNKGHLLRYAPQPTPETHDSGNSKTEEPPKREAVKAIIDNKMKNIINHKGF